MTGAADGGRIGEIITKLDNLKEGVDELKDGQTDQRRVAEELRSRVSSLSHLPSVIVDHEARLRIAEGRQFTTPAEHAELKAAVVVLADRMKIIWGMLGAAGIAFLGIIAHIAGIFAGGGGGSGH